MAREWETEITRDGMWPFKWSWKVVHRSGAPRFDYDIRMGEALTKERARRKVVRARLSMERDDVKILETVS